MLRPESSLEHLQPGTTSGTPPSRAAAHLAAAVLGLLAVGHVAFSRLSWQGAALQTDAGMWAYIGRRILDGGVLYRELWESKPPGIYYVFAAVERIFGSSADSALVWLDGLLTCSILGATYIVARRFASRAACLGVMLLLSLVLCHRVLADWGNNVEKYVALFEVAACGLVLTAGGGGRVPTRWLLAGLCCGLAMLFKQTGVLFMVVGLIAALRQWRRQARPQTLLPLLGLVAGAAVVWIPVTLGLAAAGAFEGFRQQVLLYDLLRVGGQEGEQSRLLDAEHWGSVVGTAALGLVLFGPALIGGVLWHRNHRASREDAPPDSPDERGMWVVVLYALLTFACFVVAPYGYGHYLLQAAPPAAVLAAWFFDRAADERRLSHVGFLVVGVLALGVWTLRDHLAFTFHRGYVYRLAYQQQQRHVAALADTIARYTHPEQSVMIWPTDYAVSYAADRRTPLECSNSDVIFKGKIVRLSPGMPDLLARLRSQPPDVIVDWSPVQVEFTGAGTAGGETILLTPANGFSFWEEPMADHPRLEGRMLAPLKEWVRAEYGGQRRIGGCTFYYRGQPWRTWQEVLQEAGTAR